MPLFMHRNNFFQATLSRSLMALSFLMVAPFPTAADDLQSPPPTYELKNFTVVTTGTRTERLLKEAPIKTDVLGSDLFKSAAISELGQALELLNGARTESNCQNCGTAEIQLLGLPGNYNQILVDGLPLFTGVASVYGIDQVPTIFIDRMEVVKGGGSALYGPGAVAGVINLIPEEPFRSHGHIDFSASNIDGEPAHTSQFANFFVSSDQRLKAALYGLYGQQNEYDANGDGFSDLVERENSTIGTYLWWTPFESTRLRFNYQRIDETRRGGDQLGQPEEFAQIAESLETEYHWATLRWDQEVSDRFNFSLSTALVDFTRDSYYGGTGGVIIDPAVDTIDYGARTVNGGGNPETDAFFGNPTDGTGGGSFNSFGLTETQSNFYDAKFEYTPGELGATGHHRLVFGIQYEEESIQDDQLNAEGDFLAVLHHADYNNLGFFLQNEWQVTDTLELVPGIRFDKASTLEDWVASPRIAARYTASRELTWRANYSSGFLAPRVFDEDIHIENIGGVPRDIVNTPGLQEERSHTVGIGADYTPAALEGRLMVATQLYHTVLKDSFDLDEGSITVVGGREKIQRINTGGSTISGIELDLSYRFDRHWSTNVGIAYSRARFEQPDPDRGTTRYNKTPDWSGLIQINYDNDDLLDAFINLKWTGEMLADRLDSVVPGVNHVEETPHFFVVDLGISKTLSLNEAIDLTLRASINNLLDAYQDDLESGFARDPGYVYGPRYPRTFTLGARIDF